MKRKTSDLIYLGYNNLVLPLEKRHSIPLQCRLINYCFVRNAMNLLNEEQYEYVMKIHGNQIIGNHYFTASFITHPEKFHSSSSVPCMEWYRVWHVYVIMILGSVRGFPKIDHSGIIARIILEQNKIRKMLPKGINTPSVKRQWQRQCERQIGSIGINGDAPLMLQNRSQTDSQCHH